MLLDQNSPLPVAGGKSVRREPRMAPMKCTRVAGIGAGLLLSGCVFDPAVPASAIIQCTGDADCPEGKLCHPTINTCVSSTDLELEPPALVGDPALDRSVGTIGTKFILSLDVTEALAEPPRAFVNDGDEEIPFALDENASDATALHYELSYVATGREAEGLATVTIDLLDQSGNRADEIQGGAITFDFTPPALVTAPTPTPASVTAGAATVLTLSFDEDLAEAPALELRSASDSNAAPLAWPLDQQVDPRTFRFRLVPAGTEAEGPRNIATTARDLAGNVIELALPAKLTIDFTAPTAENVLLSPTAARPGDIVVATVTLSEPAEAVATLVSEGGTATLGFDLDAQSTSSALVYRHVVREGEDGIYDLSLQSVSDAAHNSTPPIALGTLTIDGTPAALLDYSQNKQSLLGSDTLLVTFRADETLASDPIVKVGTHELVRTAGPDPYVYELPLLDTGLAGSLAIQVDLADLAGNRSSFLPGGATIDARAPAIVDVVFSPASARLGSRVLLTVTVDERLGSPPALSWVAGADLPFTFLSQSGFNYNFSFVVDDSVAEGNHALAAVALVDEAGNAATVDLASALGSVPVFSIDNVPPALDALATTGARFSAEPGFDLVEVSFDCSEDLGPSGSLEVTIGDVPMSCTPRQATSPNHSCSYVVTGFETEGHNLIAVSARDAAGNVGIASASVELDFTGPGIAADSTAVQLIPGPGNLLASVSAVSAGTEARVVFVANEPLSADPLVATSAPEALPFTKLSSAGVFYSYRHSLQGTAHAQGAYVVEATLTDQVGNTATRIVPLPAPGLVVDTVGPVPLTPAQRDLLLYARRPWGADDSNGQPQFTLESTGAGAVPANTTVVVWDGEDTTSAIEVGRTVASAQGGVARFSLVRSDRPSVFISQVDEAGNLDSTTAAQVGHVEWVATMGGKVVGSTFENPHRYLERQHMPAHFDGGPGGDVTGNATLRIDGVSLATSGAVGWTHRTLTPAATFDAVVYDQIRGRLVARVANSQSMMERTSEAWHAIVETDPENDGSPPFRFEPQPFVHDPHLGATLLFDRNVPWVWNGTSWAAGVLTDPEGDGEPSTSSFARSSVAYDVARSRIVILQVSSSGVDTWEWTGTSWSRRVPTDPEGDGNPSVMPGPTGQNIFPFVLAYDHSRARIVASAGLITFEWDGVSWARRTPSDPEGDGNPVSLQGHALVYDAARGVTLLFGGSATTGFFPPFLSDLWAWNGVSWVKQVPTDPEGDGNPPNKAGRLVYDDVHQVSVLLQEGQIWEWNGTSWRRLPFSNDPEFDGNPVGTYEDISFDSARGVAVLGFGTAGGRDMWEWNGFTWRLASASHPDITSADFPRQQAFDASRGRTVMFVNGKTFEYDGTTIVRKTPTDPGGDGNPGSAPTKVALAYDSARNVVIFVGRYLLDVGLVRNETWEWDGASWARRTSTPSLEAIAGPLAYDAARARTVLYNFSRGTWEWDGFNWTKSAPLDPEGDGDPPDSSGHDLTYDPVRGRVLYTGGAEGASCSPTFANHWAWDGTSWEHLRFADPESDGAPPSCGHVATFDSRTNRMMLVPENEADGVWLSNIPGPVGHVMSVALPASGLPRSAIESVTARFSAGGTGEEGGSQVQGATLQAWLDGQWMPLAETSASAASPSLMAGSITGAAASRLAFGRDEAISISVVTHGASVRTMARLAVDMAEVRVRFRMP